MGGYNEKRSKAQCLVNKLVASVAQLVEQLTLNQLVLGSSPSRGTTSVMRRVQSIGENLAGETLQAAW